MHHMHIGAALGALAAVALATPALAGEITGNGKEIEINGRSLCAYSGINDTPDGLALPIGPGGALVEIEPGVQVQSYGYFKSHGGDFLQSPSDPAAREIFAFPGVGCNPVK
jgi:hypothetical protein